MAGKPREQGPAHGSDPAPREPEDGPGADRYSGPLLITRVLKEDGRGLILYRAVEDRSV